MNKKQSHGLLWKCLTASLAVHAALLAYVYYDPMLLQGPFSSLFGMTQAKPVLLELDTAEEDQAWKNHVLQEVFEPFLVLSSHFQAPYDLVELPQGIALAPSEEETPSAFPAQEEECLAFEPPESEFIELEEIAIQAPEESEYAELFTAAADASFKPQTPQIDTPSLLTPLSHIDIPLPGQGEEETLLSASLYAVAPEPQGVLQLFFYDTPTSLTNSAPLASTALPPDLTIESPRAAPFISVAQAPASTKQTIQVASRIHSLDHYALSDMATATTQWNDDFDVAITFLPSPEGKGYIFSLALTSNYDLSSHGLKQNLYFILDRSSSIQKHRFAVFKRGVLKALANMQRGDTFNIFVMDKKVVQFSSESTPVTQKNIQAAEAFLDKQEGGGLFTSSDIYSTLDHLLLSVPKNEEAHTAILLTDGKMQLNAKRQRTQLNNWIEKNNGQMALYACAVGSDNDLLTLDLLTQVSGGKLLYSDTHASFPRKLAKLILDLRDPVIKDVILTATPHNPSSHIEFYPAASHLSQLYGHQPYVIVGQIDDPCAFDLTLQGRHRDQWIAIKKNISFVDGHKGDHTLERKWSAEHANVCYSKFLQSGKDAYLKEAKEILKKSHSEVAFR